MIGLITIEQFALFSSYDKRGCRVLILKTIFVILNVKCHFYPFFSFVPSLRHVLDFEKPFKLDWLMINYTVGTDMLEVIKSIRL